MSVGKRTPISKYWRNVAAKKLSGAFGSNPARPVPANYVRGACVEISPGTYRLEHKNFSLKRDWDWMRTRYDMQDLGLCQAHLERLVNETGYDDLTTSDEVHDAMKNCSDELYPVLICALKIISPGTEVV